jgi:hypothetical protein
MVNYKCPFCKRTFSSHSGYSQHINVCNPSSSDESDDDSEEEPLMISLGDAFKSLKTWIEFFEQQFIDEFDVKDMDVFKKYFAIVQRLESQARKQSSITEFFSIHNN